MAHLVIAYPELAPSDLARIQRFRELNDELFFKVVAPHFTLVFPVFDRAAPEFIHEIKRQAQGMGRIPFDLKCAVINKDAFSAHYHAFLVPDEGFGRIVRLHDKLYSGRLEPERRLDIDYPAHRHRQLAGQAPVQGDGRRLEQG